MKTQKPKNYLKPKEILKALIEKAITRGYLIANPEADQVHRLIAQGKDLPEKCKPGRLLDHLTAEEREELKKLTSKDIANDWPTQSNIW